jgi:hypothetical protein
MSDAALENAMARRANALETLKALVKEINILMERHGKARAELEEIDNFIQMWHTMAGMTAPELPERKESVGAERAARRIRPSNPRREMVADACVNYLREAGHPLMRSELMELLKLNDIEIHGKDPAMVLSTMLWRSKDKIARLPKGGYWLPGLPMPGEPEPTLSEMFD